MESTWAEVEATPFRRGDDFLCILQPRRPNVPLAEWIRDHRAEVETLLLKSGAVLCRGFELSVEGFQAVANAVSTEELDLVGGNSPRVKVADGVFTSTEYPKHMVLEQHHERSFRRRWPLKLLFYCDVAPLTAGETPLCSTRRFMSRLPPRLLERYAQNEIEYTRRYTGYLSWKGAFGTEDRAVVESTCREWGVTPEWGANDSLTTTHVAQAFAVHPRTGERLYFNQSHNFHRRSHLHLKLPEGALPPSDAAFAGGLPLDTEDVGTLIQIFREESVSFPWAKGDCLLIDNMLATHGRNPFDGPRRVLTALREPHSG